MMPFCFQFSFKTTSYKMASPKFRLEILLTFFFLRYISVAIVAFFKSWLVMFALLLNGKAKTWLSESTIIK